MKERMKERIGEIDAEIIYCEGEMSTNLTTGKMLAEFCFNQVEADTMLISAYAKMREEINFTGTIVIDSEDTDVYVSSAYVSCRLQGELLIKHKSSLFRCSDMLPHDVADIIIPLHIITGCDYTSGFYGHGKKSVLDKVKKDPAARGFCATLVQHFIYQMMLC